MIIINKNINIGVILQTVGSYFCFCLIKHIHSYQTMSENMPKNNVKASNETSYTYRIGICLVCGCKNTNDDFRCCYNAHFFKLV